MCSSHKLVYGHFGATFDFVMIMRTGGHKNAVERSYLIIAVHVLWNRIFLLWFFLQGNFPLADSSTRPNTRIIMATVRGIKAEKKKSVSLSSYIEKRVKLFKCIKERLSNSRFLILKIPIV